MKTLTDGLAKELIEKLRDTSEWGDMQLEAADTIERLESEVATWKHEAMHGGHSDKLRSERDALALDAARYRAIKVRHAYLFVMRMIGLSGYSSDKASSQIDQFSDSAIADVAAYESMTQEQKDLHGIAQLKRAEITAMKGGVR